MYGNFLKRMQKILRTGEINPKALKSRIINKKQQYILNPRNSIDLNYIFLLVDRI